MTTDTIKARALVILSRHVGRNRMIGMGELYERIYNEAWKNRINDTRKLRTLITSLRRDGVPVSSSPARSGGYFLASSGSEMDEFCRRLRNRALKILSLEAKLRRKALPEIIGQIQVNLVGDARGERGDR